MKSLTTIAFLSLAVFGVATPAIGQQELQRGRDAAKGPGHGEARQFFLRPSDPARSDGRIEQSSQREAAQRPDELRALSGPGVVPAQVRERLSAEERRQLRRDIHAAGRDIYRRQRPE